MSGVSIEAIENGTRAILLAPLVALAAAAVLPKNGNPKDDDDE